MSGYAVKTIYPTIQGEGAHQGRPAVFCRFAGCNLWTGRDQDRGKAICAFCDTDFIGIDGPGGGHFKTAGELAEAIATCWPETPHPDASPEYASEHSARPFVVCTGGEPLLQVDEELIDALHSLGFEIAVETNGTRRAPQGLDWLTVSPKSGADLAITEGDEMKLVYPQPGADPEQYEDLAFDHFYLQPMDGPNLAENTRKVIDYCLHHPKWRVSIQLHKLLGIP